MTDLAASPGPRLKAERERRGLSSQKVADELHLDGWIVDALEAEDYERIGPSVYAKGHLKRYAAMLGLPAAEIMAGYEARAAGTEATLLAARQRADARRLGGSEQSSPAANPRFDCRRVADPRRALVEAVAPARGGADGSRTCSGDSHLGTGARRRRINPGDTRIGRATAPSARLRARPRARSGAALRARPGRSAGIVPVSAPSTGARRFGGDTGADGGVECDCRDRASSATLELFRGLVGGCARCRGPPGVRRQRPGQQREDHRGHRAHARLLALGERCAAGNQQPSGRDRAAILCRRRGAL